MLELLLPVALTIAVLTALGTPIAYALGLRGLWAAALTPVFALSAIVTASLVAPVVGINWSILPAAVIALAMALVLFLVRRAVTGKGLTTSAACVPAAAWATQVAFVLAAVVITTQVLLIIGDAQNFSQTYDNIFHLNATRFILDELNASPYHVGTVSDFSGAPVFYPAGWHALVAIVSQLSGASIPLAINAVTIVIAAGVWPLGALLLTRTLFPNTTALTIATGVVAASVSGFPILLLEWGVLYPMLLGFAMVPAVLALTMAVVSTAETKPATNLAFTLIALLGALPALALVHPGSLVAWLVFSVPVVITGAIVACNTHRKPLPIVGVVGGLGVYLALVYKLIEVLRPPVETRTWPIDRRMREAVVDILTLDLAYSTPLYIAAFLVLAGIVFALVRHTAASITAIALWGVGAMLFFFVTSAPWQELRDFLTGSWYNNTPRIVALLTIVAVPLAAYGLSRAWEMLVHGLKLDGDDQGAKRIGLGAAATIVVLAILQLTVMPSVIGQAQISYRISDDSLLISTDELALINRLGDHVPEGARIAGSPWTGTALAYALADRRVLVAHTAGGFDSFGEIIIEHLNEAGLTPAEVCPALAAHNVEFILDFGPREVHENDNSWRYPGFNNLEESDAVELIDQEGENAKLYRIVACPTGR